MFFLMYKFNIIFPLQSEASDKKDSDILSLQLQLSELREIVTKRESEKEAVSAELITSSRVVRTLEEVPAELNILSEELHPHEPVAESCRVQPPPVNVPSTLSTTSDDEDVPSVVIDNGSGFIRAGFGGKDNPHSVFPSVIGYHNNKAHYIGHEAQNKRDILSLRYPIERGIITNWDDMEKLWHHTFYNELQVDPTDHPTLLIESCFNQPNQEKMVEIMFETFNVPATYVMSSSLLPLYSSCRTTAVTVNIGDGVSSVVPVYEGYVLSHARFRLDIGGRDLTDYLARLLVQEGYVISVGKKYACEIKEKLCYTVLNESRKQKTDGVSKPYELQDGTIISLTDMCRYMCPEALFQPNLLGMSSAGVHEMTYNCIMKCDEDVRKDMFSNIVLSGGSTLFPGFAERLKNEITALAPPRVRIKVIATPERRYHSWIGGSVLVSLSTFQQMWITKQEYEESGLSVARAKLLI